MIIQKDNQWQQPIDRSAFLHPANIPRKGERLLFYSSFYKRDILVRISDYLVDLSSRTIVLMTDGIQEKGESAV